MMITRFEDRLLAELRQVVADRPAPPVAAAQSASSSHSTARLRRPRLLLGGGAAAAVAAAVLLVTAGGDGVTPAFAIDHQPNGNVTVTINRLSDAADLQRQLRADGIPTVVNYTPLGKMCREPRGRPAPNPSHPVTTSVSGSTSLSKASTTFTISRDMVGAGQTLVIETSGGAGASSVGMRVVEGAVSPCVLVDAPTPPAGPAHGVSTGGSEQGSSSGPATRALHTAP
jgi:hypothetical protein